MIRMLAARSAATARFKYTSQVCMSRPVAAPPPTPQPRSPKYSCEPGAGERERARPRSREARRPLYLFPPRRQSRRPPLAAAAAAAADYDDDNINVRVHGCSKAKEKRAGGGERGKKKINPSQQLAALPNSPLRVARVVRSSARAERKRISSSGRGVGRRR